MDDNLQNEETYEVWTMAGCPDRLKKVYNIRYFSDVKCPALTCEDNELRKRMQEGHGITDENWIDGSCNYNRYFMEYDSLYDIGFDTFDITGKEPAEVAEYVTGWVYKNVKCS